MAIFAIVDTNVIISALLSRHPDSATVQVLDYIFDGTIIPIYNNEILAEYSSVLHRSKFNFPEHLIKQTLESIKTAGLPSERINSNETLPDAKDLVFYEITLSVEDSYLITGNIRHFPNKPNIVTPSEMIQIIMAHENTNILSDPPTLYKTTNQ